MEPHNESLFDAHALESPAALVAALAPPPPAGHFDELRGAVAPATEAPADGARTATAPPLLYDALQPGAGSSAAGSATRSGRSCHSNHAAASPRDRTWRVSSGVTP